MMVSRNFEVEASVRVLLSFMGFEYLFVCCRAAEFLMLPKQYVTREFLC